jgi:hypothetical protein
VVLAPLAILLATACMGSLRVSSRTEIRSPSEVGQVMEVQATGPLGTALSQAAESPADGGLRRQGWEIVAYRPGPETAIVARRTIRGALASQPAIGGGMDGGQQTLAVEEGVFSRDYRYRAILRAASTTPGPASVGPAGGPRGQALAEPAVQVRFTVVAPGDVVDTNADERERGGGTWRLSLSQLQDGRTLTLVTRERKTLPRAIVVGATLLASMGVVVLVMRGERPDRSVLREPPRSRLEIGLQLGCAAVLVVGLAAAVYAAAALGGTGWRVPSPLGGAVSTPTPAPSLLVPAP